MAVRIASSDVGSILGGGGGLIVGRDGGLVLGETETVGRKRKRKAPMITDEEGSAASARAAEAENLDVGEAGVAVAMGGDTDRRKGEEWMESRAREEAEVVRAFLKANAEKWAAKVAREGQKVEAVGGVTEVVKQTFGTSATRYSPIHRKTIDGTGRTKTVIGKVGIRKITLITSNTPKPSPNNVPTGRTISTGGIRIASATNTLKPSPYCFPIWRKVSTGALVSSAQPPQVAPSLLDIEREKENQELAKQRAEEEKDLKSKMLERMGGNAVVEVETARAKEVMRRLTGYGFVSGNDGLSE